MREKRASTDGKDSGKSGGPYTAIASASAVLYYISNPNPQGYYDYTFRVAANMLGGRVAFTETPPSWLNEFVPFEGFFYSVFPLGSVISMMPFALLNVLGVITDMPAGIISALCAGVICLFLFLIGKRYDLDRTRLVVMSLGVLFGTWMWTNLTMAGAWQLALGFAMVGELGAIYFTVYDRRPIVAGMFFALAFGNRTEVLLTAPVFLWLLWSEKGRKGERKKGSKGDAPSDATGSPTPFLPFSRSAVLRVALFCVAPFLLGVATLIYNYVRFHSFTDFGYARIPGVLNEPWYNHGIFSPYYIPGQMWEMFWHAWETRSTFPYVTPNPYSSSILWSSPFLFFALRFGARDRVLKWAAWIAVIFLCILLWMHGNSGGWQFGYRYAMVCLPWLFVIMLESSPKKLSPLEWLAYGLSFAANIYATWLFHWTTYLQP
ncbi:MAG TPA: hypothetical protein VJV05_02350 [Pyrinomonadaceae bacterium]|nr:hypothetical protein [Pyrinomonadaceae bacterium]